MDHLLLIVPNLFLLSSLSKTFEIKIPIFLYFKGSNEYGQNQNLYQDFKAFAKLPPLLDNQMETNL